MQDTTNKILHFVLQRRTFNGWEDATFSTVKSEARMLREVFEEQEPFETFRLIKRMMEDQDNTDENW